MGFAVLLVKQFRQSSTFLEVETEPSEVEKTIMG